MPAVVSLANSVAGGDLAGTYPNPTVKLLYPQVFNVKAAAYGAAGNGIADDTAAINSAIAALNAAGGGILFFPKGTYNVASALTAITVSAVVLGASPLLSVISASAPNIDVLSVGYGWTVVENLRIQQSGVQTSGAGIVIDTALNDMQVYLHNVILAGTYYGVREKDNTAYVTISHCHFSQNYKYGIWRSYAGVGADGGDDFYVNNSIVSSVGVANSAGIKFDAHGGPKIIGNKIIGNWAYGIDITPADGAVTGITSIVGNSIDAGPTTAIRLVRSGTTGAWGSVAISGNVLTGVTTGIDIGAGVDGVAIDGNVVGALGTGINIASGASGVIVGSGNCYPGVATQIADASAASGTPVHVEFTGVVAVNANTEAGANTIVTATAHTFDGTTPVLIEFFAPTVGPAAGDYIVLCLYDGAASIGFLGSVLCPAAATINVPVRLSRRLTPSAASHTYSVRAYRNAANGAVTGGVGGAGAYEPGFIRITQVEA